MKITCVFLILGLVQAEMINVLMTGLMMGSHLQNEWELARAMALEPDFNVTFVTSYDFQPDFVSENGQLHMYRLSEISQDDCISMLIEMNMDHMSWWGIWSRHVADTLLNNEEHIQFLQSQNFQMILNENLKADEKLARVLNLAHVQMSFYAVTPDINIRQRIPNQSSHTINLIANPWALQNTKMHSFFTRLDNLYFQSQVLRLFDNVDKLIGKEPTYQYLFGSGIHGISDAIQWTQASELVFPMSKLSSKYSDKFNLTLDAEYEEFLSRYDQGVILVTFGTTFQPTPENTLKIISILQSAELQNYGIIFGLKDMSTTQQAIKEIKQMNKTNILLKDYVPQKQLLNDDRVKLFVTHCGANSVHEAFYFGTTVYGLPIDADQPGICKRIHHNKLGICGNIEDPERQHVEQIVQVLQKESVQQKNVQTKMRLMEFEELRSDMNVYSLSRYATKFGTKHLYHLASADKASFIQTYDLDIIFSSLAIVYFIQSVFRTK